MKLLKLSLILCTLLFTGIYCNGQNTKSVTSKEFYENYKHLLNNNDVAIIDGRTAKMYSEKHIKNAINIDADGENLLELLKEQADSPIIVVYCTTIRRTTKIVNTLKPIYNGELIYISDGIRGWLKNKKENIIDSKTINYKS
ncbi:rhodanese-like domain-containing protein [Marinilabiliaceae bacterium ANBcel2]|nr:rhodanese-like domain-containing protein [Marinilabiliaceae bacterium ANBcel2]